MAFRELSDESSTLADRAKYYHAIATAMRNVAPSMKSAEFRCELSALAANYEKLALAVGYESLASLAEPYRPRKIPEDVGP